VVEAFGGVSVSRTLLAALVAACLGAYIYWVERPKIAEEAMAERLLSFEIDDITAIELRYPDSPDISLERRADGWYMTEPLRTRGDDEPIRLLLERIRDTEIVRRIPAATAQDRATYGLQGDGERARITLVRSDGTALPDIIVGATTPVGYQAFVRVENREDVLVTPLIFHTGIGKSPFDLRSKVVFEIDSAAVDELTVGRENARVVIERDAESWRIVDPVRAPADPAAVHTIMASIDEIRALAFYDSEESPHPDFGFGDSSIAVDWRSGDAQDGFRLGAASGGSPPGFYLRRRDGLVIKAPEWVANRFDLDANGVRDKRLFSCSAAEVVEARFQRADGTEFSLRREPGHDWTFGGVDAVVRQRIADRAVEQLAELAGKQVLAADAAKPDAVEARFGLDHPDVTVTLHGTGPTDCGSATAARAAEETGHYVTRKGSGVVMSIPPYLFSRLDLRPEDLTESETAR
jgi:hypothetical protein